METRNPGGRVEGAVHLLIFSLSNHSPESPVRLHIPINFSNHEICNPFFALTILYTRIREQTR